MVMFFDLIERITRQLIYNQGVLTVVQKSHLDYSYEHLQVAAYSLCETLWWSHILERVVDLSWLSVLKSEASSTRDASVHVDYAGY